MFIILYLIIIFAVILYSGAENPVTRFRKYHSQFSCEFYLADYPFDAQLCFMEFVVRSGHKSEIIFSEKESSVIFQTTPHLTEYFVGGIHLDIEEENGYSKAKV